MACLPRWLVLVPTLLVTGLLPAAVSAKSHLWKFKEFFSNADGTVQYIEMDVTDPAGTSEWRTGGQQLASNAHVYFFPSDLPEENTFQRSMLIATEAFAALPGAPTPDFVIPAGFFDPSGDEIRYRVSLDSFVFDAGELPSDGLRALQRSDRSTPINSPTNFAGDTATVDASPDIAVHGVWPPLLIALVLAAAGLRRFGSLRARARASG